jgi:hypothetical protein
MYLIGRDKAHAFDILLTVAYLAYKSASQVIFLNDHRHIFILTSHAKISLQYWDPIACNFGIPR